AIRAEHALFAVHSACASSTNVLGEIRWPSPQDAERWMLRLLGGGEAVKDYLNCLNLESQSFHTIGFAKANLQGANLDSAVLRGTRLDAANLRVACLRKADLRVAQMSGV